MATAYFDEADAVKIRVGQPAVVTFDAIPGSTVNGVVTAVDTSATVTNNVVTYGVTVRLTGSVRGIRPGMSAAVNVTVARRRDVLELPSAAVHALSGNAATVTVRSGRRLLTVRLVIGLVGDQSTQIVSGLSAGQQVVLAVGQSGAAGSSSGPPVPGGGGPTGGGGGGMTGGGGGFGGGGAP
jgi:macrolide-specific efflux system membrane fusion protein